MIEIAVLVCVLLLLRELGRCPHGKWHCVRCDPPEIQTMPRRR